MQLKGSPLSKDYPETSLPKTEKPHRFNLDDYRDMVAAALEVGRKDIPEERVTSIVLNSNLVTDGYLKRKHPTDVAKKLARKEPLHPPKVLEVPECPPSSTTETSTSS